jgi:hypothetical protein
MWKLAFILGAFIVSLSPVDAREGAPFERVDKGAELRRDLERISREIYPERSDLRSSRGSFAAGKSAKKR